MQVGNDSGKLIQEAQLSVHDFLKSLFININYIYDEKTMIKPGHLGMTALASVLGLTAIIGFNAPAFAASGGTPQASITLTNSDAKYCYTHDNTWALTKEVTGNTIDAATGSGSVEWTVTATKDTSAAPTFKVCGGLTITNTGSAPATIGNIVVNLQKPNSPKKGSNASHVSIAADVADATNGDEATSANIVAAGSQENTATNTAWGTSNYTTSGAKGTFIETAGSGPLEFKDASDNTIFSLVPQPTIPVGGSITLLYDATFQTSVLPPAGTPLRVEAMVTFGNSGTRGGSGATASNIDINGNTWIGTDEANVRTVPSRIMLAALPADPEEANDSVTVTDPGVTTTGTVTTSNPVGFSTFPATISDTTSWTVTVDVAAGAEGGKVCNSATLEGAAVGGTLQVIVGYDQTKPIYDSITGNIIGYEPIYATYECAAAAKASASACVDVTPPDDQTIENGDYCTFSQGGFGGNGTPYDRLAANFPTLYPSGVEAGILGTTGYSMRFNTATAVQDYLPASKTANKLNADLVNPTSTNSGVFGGQVLALKLNIALSDAAVNPANFGDLYYCDAASSLNGQTVRQILAAAETTLGGGALPSGYNYSTLSELCANLDLSFDDKSTTDPNLSACGVASAWAVQHLSKVPCP